MFTRSSLYKIITPVLCGAFIVFGLLVTGILSVKTAEAQQLECFDSSLWNKTDGFISDRVTDWSYAGYKAGENLPNNATQINIKNAPYNAAGDGVTDDTDAFKAAIAAASGVIYIPEGEYVITEPLVITNDGVVLRGDGINKTVLRFPKSLIDLACENKSNPTACFNNTQDAKTYSHDGAFIQFGEGSQMAGRPRNIGVTAPADRGERALKLESVAGLEIGQWVLLQMDGNPDASISLHQRLQGGNAAGVTNSSIEEESARFIYKITNIYNNTIILDPPLNTDVRYKADTGWNATVSAHETSVSDVGIEKLRIVFPFTEYTAHFNEYGYNALAFQSATDCWASDISIFNSDNGIDVNRSAFCTIDNVKFNDSIAYEDDKATQRTLINSIKNKWETKSPTDVWQNEVPPTWLGKKVIRGEYSGHHGITVAASSHILMTNSKFFNRFVHDITTTSYANMNVFSDIEGFDLTLDHHRRAPHNNLFTDINVGLGTHVWRSSGVCRSDSDCFGPHSGAYNTYWNIYKSDSGAIPLPTEKFDNKTGRQDFGLKLNFVLNTNNATKKNALASWVVEDINSKTLCVPDLYEAMKNSSHTPNPYGGTPVTSMSDTPTQTTAFDATPATLPTFTTQTDTAGLYAMIFQLLERVRTLRAQFENM